MEGKAKAKNVVICGGGIIGCASAYFLTKLSESGSDLKVTLIERCEIACHSSGKAGGFLALDWNDHSPVGCLARKSFDLHSDLSQELEAEIDYRRLNTHSVLAEPLPGEGATIREPVPEIPWLDGRIKRTDLIGSHDSTAQVNPLLLTKAMMDAARSRGAELVEGVIESFKLSSDAAVTAVVLEDGREVEADVVVVALGAWSTIVAGPSFPKANLPMINASRAHSVIIKKTVSADAVFLTYKDRKQKEPEIYPRPDGTVYLCGEGDDEPLPEDPATIAPREGACEKILEIAANVSSEMEEVEIVAKQACYLPTSPDHLPLIGKIPGYGGAYIATGHGCWGILNGPATGLCIAQLLLEMPTDVDLSKFSPSRFCPEND